MKRTVIITGLLAVLAVISAVSIVQSARAYQLAMEVVRAFRLELSGLELADEEEPEVQVGFRVANNSPVDVELDSLRFSLYLNGQFMGSNYEPFQLRTVDGRGETTMGFVIPIEPFYQQYLDRAEERASYSWSIKGRYKLVLPFKERPIWLNLQSQWSGS